MSSPSLTAVSDGASYVVFTSRSSTRYSKKRKGVFLPSLDPGPVTAPRLTSLLSQLAWLSSAHRRKERRSRHPVDSVHCPFLDCFRWWQPTSSPKKNQRIPRSLANLSKTSTTGVAATSSSTSPHLLAPTDTRNNSPSTPVATAAIGLPEPLAVPYSLLRARAGQVVARKSRSTPAMRASLGIHFSHHCSDRCCCV